MKQVIYDAQTKTETFVEISDSSNTEFFGGEQVLSADERLDVLEPEVDGIVTILEAIV